MPNWPPRQAESCRRRAARRNHLDPLPSTRPTPTKISPPPGSFRYAPCVLLALLLLLGEALPGHSRIEAAALEGVDASCPGQRVSVDPDLTRACQQFTEAVRDGRAPVSGPAVSFFASLESYEP